MEYIDADLLKRKLKDVATEFKTGNYYLDNSEQAVGYENALIDFEQIIDSLQQEQLPGIEEHGIPGKDFIPVEWVDACEKYGKWKIVQQEQPEIDLEKEYKEYVEDDPVFSKLTNRNVGFAIARHFYGLVLMQERRKRNETQ